LTLGLAWILVIMQTAYVATGKETCKSMTKFWGKLFVIDFAMGVVTGSVQEFQFGMNWSEYSRVVGDIFGAPLGVEGLLAFFLESTLLGLWIFGWDKLPKRIHLASIWLVAISSSLSALWILIANWFMHAPVGDILRGPRAEMTSFPALLTNTHVWLQFPHVLASGLATAAFIAIGISVYHLVRKTDTGVFRPSFRIGAAVGLVATLLVIVVGSEQAEPMVRVQPMKMVAAEASFESQDPAGLSLISIGSADGGHMLVDVHIPGLLSFLAYNRVHGELRGINHLQAEFEQVYGPGDCVPPVWLDYWSVRLMVAAGFRMLVLAGLALFLSLGSRLENLLHRIRFFPPAIALPDLVNTTGWILTETGRLPWVVYGPMRIEDAGSPTVSAGMVLTSLIGFTLIYGLLMFATIYLLSRYARGGPHAILASERPSGAPSLVGAD
jgi:cytochrome d ubiquinol oxidase subunit I